MHRGGFVLGHILSADRRGRQIGKKLLQVAGEDHGAASGPAKMQLAFGGKSIQAGPGQAGRLNSFRNGVGQGNIVGHDWLRLD